LATLEEPGKSLADRIQSVVKAYQGDLDQLLKRTRPAKRQELVEELRKRINSFDSQITATAQQDNPELRKVSPRCTGIENRPPLVAVMPN
jgi:hypothetical protein